MPVKNKNVVKKVAVKSNRDKVIAYKVDLQVDIKEWENGEVSTKRTRFVDNHTKMCNKIIEITKKKNADYSGSSNDNPFANFVRVELTDVCSTETGMLVRMSDKMSRISTFVKKGILLVEDESIEDTLMDLANYAIIMACYIKEQKTKKE